MNIYITIYPHENRIDGAVDGTFDSVTDAMEWLETVGNDVAFTSGAEEMKEAVKEAKIQERMNMMKDELQK